MRRRIAFHLVLLISSVVLLVTGVREIQRQHDMDHHMTAVLSGGSLAPLKK